MLGLNKLPDFDPKEVQDLMSSLDTDKSGRVDYSGIFRLALSELSAFVDKLNRIPSCDYGKEPLLKRGEAFRRI